MNFAHRRRLNHNKHSQTWDSSQHCVPSLLPVLSQLVLRQAPLPGLSSRNYRHVQICVVMLDFRRATGQFHMKYLISAFAQRQCFSTLQSPPLLTILRRTQQYELVPLIYLIAHQRPVEITVWKYAREMRRLYLYKSLHGETLLVCDLFHRVSMISIQRTYLG